MNPVLRSIKVAFIILIILALAIAVASYIVPKLNLGGFFLNFVYAAPDPEFTDTIGEAPANTEEDAAFLNGDSLPDEPVEETPPIPDLGTPPTRQSIEAYFKVKHPKAHRIHVYEIEHRNPLVTSDYEMIYDVYGHSVAVTYDGLEYSWFLVTTDGQIFFQMSDGTYELIWQ